MGRFDITPDEAEQLLNGRAFERDDLFELRDFVRTAAAMKRSQPSKRAEQRHLLAIVEATQMELLSAPPPATRSKPMARSILRSKIFKAFAGAIAAVLAMGGLAAAQTLPAPAQDAMAAVAERVGIQLPHSDEFKAKHGADHDGDGVADDNGLHTGQTGEKRGADHDGDGTADDNGLHKGQNAEKRGMDHDGDGTADDNGLHKGDTQSDDDDDGNEVDDDDDDGDEVDDDGDEVDDQSDNEANDHGESTSEENKGRGNGSGDDAQGHDEDDEPQTAEN